LAAIVNTSLANRAPFSLREVRKSILQSAIPAPSFGRKGGQPLDWLFPQETELELAG
jgi:hypothetical protein